MQTKSNQVNQKQTKDLKTKNYKYLKAPAGEKVCNKGGLLVSHRFRDGYKAHREGIVVTKLWIKICNKSTNDLNDVKTFDRMGQQLK